MDEYSYYEAARARTPWNYEENAAFQRLVSELAQVGAQQKLSSREFEAGIHPLFEAYSDFLYAMNPSGSANDKPAVISFAEARRLLIAVSDDDRSVALGMLARTKQSDTMWTNLIRPFLLEAWPRQLKYQTEASSRQLAQIAENAGDRFPEVVALVLPFLRPVAHLDTFAYRLKKQGEEGQGYSARFPVETLTLLNALVGDDPQTPPWNLGELLDVIADTNPALRQSDPWRRLKAITQ